MFNKNGFYNKIIAVYKSNVPENRVSNGIVINSLSRRTERKTIKILRQDFVISVATHQPAHAARASTVPARRVTR